jgi:histidinol-phosphate/aromatic aminotransferase/cobyric acid decarboxylase-like protein
MIVCSLRRFCVLSTAELQDVVDAAPPDAVLVVDEAYHEYAGG